MLSDIDAKLVTKAILAMRGVNQKKHRIQHEEGSLELQIRPMAYKGTSIAWMRNMNLRMQEDWCEEPAMPDGPLVIKVPLKQILCPKCSFAKSTEHFKMKSKLGFSMMKCLRCKHTTSSSLWRCVCRSLWYKCDEHVHNIFLNSFGLMKVNRGTVKLPGRVPAISMNGHDVPFPKKRGTDARFAVDSNVEVAGPPLVGSTP